MIMSDKKLQIEILRHSTAHVMAAAVLEMFPEAKFGIGPDIENGFYYDLELPRTLIPEDLPLIEKKIAKIIKDNHPFEREEIEIDKASELFEKAKQNYKVELIEDLKKEGEKKVSLYKSGDFVDLCRGPHLDSTGEINVKALKLTHIAGAYWRGDEKRPMLQRIYGVAFASPKELRQYLAMMEEAKKRDHRKLGKELDLFSFHPEAPGDVFWHDKGYTVFKELIDYWRGIHRREGYQEVRTPEIMTKQIWQRSGHTENFLDKMYKVTTPDAKEWNMLVKPMNCDGGMLIYNNSSHSYKEFPIKVGELGVVHRYESSGELHGIIRPREFTQDDAHLYCLPEQVKDELKKVIDLCFEIYDTFGLELDHLELSTRPEKSIGSDEIWEQAEQTMREVLKENNIAHQINEGDGAFYGPKFDFHLKDTIGRTWQCATIQLDFAQPENFALEYIAEDGSKQRPVMIHRTIYGSIERFLGILVEHYAGAFPLWLSPTQVKIIPVSDQFLDYAGKVKKELDAHNIRVEIDDRTESVGKKISDNIKDKTPYALVVGEKEIESQQLAVRTRGKKEIENMEVERFVEKLRKEITNKTRS
ncbi:threonine--tRNA ligase [Patescibacteria group bacterium]|nr:threonine--tRNA ligase [Patescibacteria group bacterium]